MQSEYSNKKPTTNDQHGKIWASIVIPENFTALTDERFVLGRSTPDADIDVSFVSAAVDKTSQFYY